MFATVRWAAKHRRPTCRSAKRWRKCSRVSKKVWGRADPGLQRAVSQDHEGAVARVIIEGKGGGLTLYVGVTARVGPGAEG